MFRPVALPGGELLLDDQWLPAHESRALFDALLRETPWKHEAITIAGRKVMQPRLTAWYGDPDASYRYSGLTVHPLEWTPHLARLRSRVEESCRHAFNSVLLNHYRDGQDAMGMHSDDEPELGRNPVIASVSLGAPRRLVFKYRDQRAGVPNVELPLGDGSLLVMAGATQHAWKHGVPRQSAPCGPRINLTFRRILQRATARPTPGPPTAKK